MSINFRAELQQLVQAYDEHGGRWPEHHADALYDAVEHARAILIQPVAEGLTDEELCKVICQAVREYWEQESPFGAPADQRLLDLAKARAILARWGHPTTPATA